MKFSINQKAVIALSVVAFSYALLNVAIRLMNEVFSPFTQVYLRIGLGFLLTAILLYKNIRPSRFLTISKVDWVLLILMGSVGYGFSVDFITLGALHTKLLNVAVIASTTPFFIFLFNTFVLKKTFRGHLFFFLLLTFYGIFVISTKSFIPALTSFGSGDFYVLLFAIGLGVYIMGRKYLSAHLNNTEIAVIVMFIAFVSSLLSAMLSGETLQFSGFFNPLALLGLFLGGVLNLVATTLETFGFKHINAVTGSQLLLLENVFGPAFGFFFYHELILPIEFMGAVFVLIGIWAYIRRVGE